jgi:putative FmdB family regulatory protein
MPIYEYVCQSCEKKTEAIQRVGEKPLRVCPHCGGKLKKAFSAPAIQFKGSGWYITDYARAKKEEKAEKADKSEKAEKTPEKSDKGEKTSKPEKKEKKAKE